jgi:hypothetical protein
MYQLVNIGVVPMLLQKAVVYILRNFPVMLIEKYHILEKKRILLSAFDPFSQEKPGLSIFLQKQGCFIHDSGINSAFLRELLPPVNLRWILLGIRL